MKGQPAQTDFPDEFVIWAREKMKQDKEYILHRAQFGSPLIKNIAQMILAAAGGRGGDEMAMMKKKKIHEKKKPYQGSIVIVRHPMFDEKTRSDRTFWRYEIPNEERVIEGDMQPSCCDLKLRQLFKAVGMEEPITKKSKEEKTH